MISGNTFYNCKAKSVTASCCVRLLKPIENEQFVKSDNIILKELFNEVCEEIGHRLEEKQILMSITISPDAIFKNCNRDLLFQFTYNLINNAIKYNKEKGEILIKDQISKDGTYSISITDTGIGIPAEEINTIFRTHGLFDSEENCPAKVSPVSLFVNSM